MRLEQDIGHDHLVLEFRVLPLLPRVLVSPQVEPGPAVEAPFFDVRDVVGDEVVAQAVALVDRGPQDPRPGLDRQADRVPDAGGVKLLVLPVGVEDQDVRPPLLGIVVVDVRLR